MTPAGKTGSPVAERFWGHVAIAGPDDCWPWTAGKVSRGYGGFSIGSYVDGTRRQVGAHRMAFELAYGPVPAERPNVLHRCDNPPCCNPSHLFAGTTADNMADKVAKDRSAAGATHGTHTKPESVRRGSSHHKAKLTEGDVRRIRSLYRDGLSSYEVAVAFDISALTVQRIVNRTSWRHVA